ncbi:uncharacterized protein PG986_004746 [Apiospora aurea]|uniref:Uncharacterized protein n=1 Tax=Apiospora aurea TaxID=335848 RepID=A0ABR1QNZ5_9PEZI
MAQLDRTNPSPEFAPNGLLRSPSLVKAALNSFPPMEPGVTMSQLIGIGAGSEERRAVLDWLCYTFEGTLVPTPQSAAVPQLPGYGSFLLMNTHAKRHAAFRTALQDTGLSNGGIAAFHGTSPHNLFNIVCDGLNGSPVVFHSNEPSYSAWFTSFRSQVAPGNTKVMVNNPQICRGWSNSKFKNVAIMFGVEVAGSPPEPRREEGTVQQHALTVRYLFILPGEKVQAVASVRNPSPIEFWRNGGWVRGEMITDRMREVYRKIHDGSLVSEIEYGATAEGQRYSVRLSPLLRDPAVLDLLFTILYAELEVASTDQYAGEGRYPSGLSAADMMSTIDTFPELCTGVAADQLIGYGPRSSERRMVLEWVCKKFEGILIQTPESAQIRTMPGCRSFIMPSIPENYRPVFETKLKELGRYNERDRLFQGGIAAFHGAPPHVLFKILCEGLRHERRIFYSQEPAHSAWYIPWRSFFKTDGGPKFIRPQVLRGWKNSKFKNVAILFGVEVAQLREKLPEQQWKTAENVEAQSPRAKFWFVTCFFSHLTKWMD